MPDHSDYPHNTTNIQSLNYLYQRLPNLLEIFINTAPKSALDLLFGRAVLAFGDNPVASSIFRDLFKIPSTITSFYESVEIGDTGINHEIGSVVALAVRIPCKAIVIGGGSFFNFELKNSGRAANYVCEPFARYFNIVDREFQIERKANPEMQVINYFQFLVYHSKKSWMFEAIGEGIFKTATSDIIGEHIIDRLGYTKVTREYATSYEESWLGLEFIKNSDIWSKFSRVQESTDVFNKIALADVGVFSVDYFAKWLPEMVTASVLMFSTRVVQDAVGHKVREFIEYFNQEELPISGVDSHHSEL